MLAHFSSLLGEFEHLGVARTWSISDLGLAVSVARRCSAQMVLGAIGSHEVASVARRVLNDLGQ